MKSLTLINVLQITIACLFVIWSVLLIYSYGTEHRETLETRAENRKSKSLDQRVQLPPDNFIDDTTISPTFSDEPETERETTVINDDVDSSEVITGEPTEVIPPEVTEEFDSRERGDRDTTTSTTVEMETEPESDNEISPQSSSTTPSIEVNNESSEVLPPLEPEVPAEVATESIPSVEISNTEASNPITETPNISNEDSKGPDFLSETPEMGSSESPVTLSEESRPTETSNESAELTEETAQPASPEEASSVSEEIPIDLSTESMLNPPENKMSTTPILSEETSSVFLPENESSTTVEPETESTSFPPTKEETSTNLPVATERPPEPKTESPSTQPETEAPSTQLETDASPRPVETEVPPTKPEIEPPQVTENLPDIPVTKAPETITEGTKGSSPSPSDSDNQDFMTERVTYTPETVTDSPTDINDPTTELNYINPHVVTDAPETKTPTTKAPSKTYAPSYDGWFYRYVPAKMGEGGTQSYWYRAENGVGLNRIDVTNPQEERRPTAMDIQGALNRELQRRKTIQHWLLQSLYQYSNTMANEIITVSKLIQTNRFEMDHSMTSLTMTEMQRLNRMLLFTNEYLQKLARFQEYDDLLSSS